MKSIIGIFAMIFLIFILLSCDETVTNDDDRNNSENDDDSPSDDDSVSNNGSPSDDNSSDDNKTGEILPIELTLPEINLEFVTINYYEGRVQSYLWNFWYNVNYVLRYSEHDWELQYQSLSIEPHIINQFWGPDPDFILGVGCRWVLIETHDIYFPYFIKYKNGQWQMDTSIDQVFEAFTGIGGTSRNNIFIIANIERDIPLYEAYKDNYVIYHYDGENIEQISIGDSTKRLNGIYVDESGEVFAAGNRWSTRIESNILLVHYNLDSWDETLFANPDNCTISQIWGASPTDIYLGGYTPSRSRDTSPNGTYQKKHDLIEPALDPCLFHFDGNDLTKVTIPYFSDFDIKIEKILGANSDQIYFALSSLQATFKLFLFDGSHFIDTNFPLNGHFSTFEDMWVSPGGDAYVVGPYKGVMHYNGEEWKLIPGRKLWKIFGFADQGTAGDMIWEQ